MELGLSSPDIVGIRIPHPAPPEFAPFLQQIPDLGEASLGLLENIHQRIEGTLEGRSFLFAIAVKRTTRSDRLYQPLFILSRRPISVEAPVTTASLRWVSSMGRLLHSGLKDNLDAAILLVAGLLAGVCRRRELTVH
jgi:hypothetical protein